MDMYELVKKWRIDDQPVVFEARLLFIRNSVPQLKWLCDNIPHSALNIIHMEGDYNAMEEDLMYIAYRFPPEGVFFDLNHERFEKYLAQYRHFSRSKVSLHFVGWEVYGWVVRVCGWGGCKVRSICFVMLCVFLGHTDEWAGFEEV
jgi:hypothetical protein